MPSWLYDDAYAEGQRVKGRFLEAYRGIPLEEALPGTPVRGGMGECYLIENAADINVSRIDRNKARAALLSNLRLLRGVGAGTEKKLREAGYGDAESLLAHRRWRDAALRLVCAVDEGDACRLQREVWHWLPKSHPLNLHVTAFADVERLAAVDIETMGLFSRPIILFGAAFADGGRIAIRQYLARDVGEEAAAIGEFCSLIGDRPIVSYNGRSFDVPYINQRRSFYDLGGDVDNVHFDVLPFARRFLRGRAPDARLTTVERYVFGQERSDDVPGALVPEFYETYLRTRNPGPLVPIVEHNRNDLVSLVRLFSMLCEECNGGD